MALRRERTSWVTAGMAAAWLVTGTACTSATGPPSTPAPTSARRTAAAQTPRPCGKQQIRSATDGFFADWNDHERRSFGQLFRNHGELDMATKHQDTLHDSTWTSAVGPAQIAAFAARQWRLGERLSDHGMTIYTGSAVAVYRGGAEVNATARFADGSIQPIEEAKFNYNCSAGTFTHVVIISAGPAAKA
jgi:hypothetical protein